MRNRTTDQGRSWRRWSAAALAAGALIAAACGSDDDAGGDDDGTAAETAAPTSDTATSETATADSTGDSGSGSEPAADGGTLRFARSDITSLDPHRAAVGPDAEILFLVYDRLVHTNPDGTLAGGLAESWEASEDGMTLTLHLREGVTFHDGAPFDAAAVVANLDRARTDEESAVKAELAPIEQVDATDDLTVGITLNAPAGNLPAILSDRAGAMVSPDALDNPDLDRNPVGAGMYTVDDYQSSAGATFERAPDYWDPDAQRLDRIEWTVISDPEAMYNALRSDQIDVATLPPSYIDRAEEDALQVVSGPTRQVYYLNLNETHEGLDDVRVRRAIAQSIDREGIVAGVFFGHGEAAAQLLPAGEVGYNPDISPDSFAFDPEGAAELLAEAGYGPGDLSYEIISFNTSPVPAINAVIAEGLNQAGIDASVRTVDNTAVAETYFVRKEGDMMQGAWSGRPSAEQTIQQLHTTTGFGNPGGWAPEGFDELFAATLAATNDDDRAGLLEELALVAHDEVLSVPIVFPYTAIGAQDRVDGLQVWTAGKLEFRGVGIDA